MAELHLDILLDEDGLTASAAAELARILAQASLFMEGVAEAAPADGRLEHKLLDLHGREAGLLRYLPEQTSAPRENNCECRNPDDGGRIMARFVPQAWQNNYAIDVDPEGETEFDVTDVIVAMGREKALQVKDNSDSSDDLASWEGAPEWIRNWRGPYYVLVESEIAAFFN